MLENKLGITTESELALSEEQISKKKALELFDKRILDSLEAGKFSSLALIHKYLFGEIYDFAGEIRKVNIAKGNGRATRIWLDLMLKSNIKQVVDWSKVDETDYLLAMERSPIKDTEIKYILKQALTKDIDNRKVYMKGIDASYNYEGYYAYKTEDLIKL